MTWEQAVSWLRAQPDQQELVKACFYDDPVEAAAERYYNTNEWAAVRAFLPNSRGRALDVGAGRGISSYALARDGWQVTALEPDPSDLVGAGAICTINRLCGLDIQIEQTFGETIPFADASFDLVYCRAVLHHAHDLPKLCAEAARVLVPGGILVATREHVVSKHSDKQTFLDGHPLHKLYGGENAYLLSEYTSAITNSGLRINNILNSWESNINLFPGSRDVLRNSIANRLKFPFPKLIPDFALTIGGALITAPGRLYSFTARKESRS